MMTLGHVASFSVLSALCSKQHGCSGLKGHYIVSDFIPDCLQGLLPGPFLLSYSVFGFIFPLFFSFLGRALD